jgi:Tol biopolymer transport system component
LPAPPSGLTGRLVVGSGSLLTTDRSLPIFVMDPYGKNMQPISQNDTGDYGILTPDGQRLIYSRFLASTSARQLQALFTNGTRPTELSSMWGNVPPLADAKMPSIAHNGSVLAFVATSLTENESTSAIYVVSAKILPPYGSSDTGPTETPAIFPTSAKPTTTKPTKVVTAAPAAPTSSAPAPTPTANGAITQVRRLTVKDTGINTWPAVSPDGTKIVYASDSKPQGVDGVDLYVVNVSGGTPKKLTDDLTANTEAAPEWSPDGKRIAYQVMAQGAKTNDIWVMDGDGSNKVALVTGSGDNIRPHWSPDGNFIVFSSTRNGKWQVYIIDLSTKTIYQVTQTTTNTICMAWGPK